MAMNASVCVGLLAAVLFCVVVPVVRGHGRMLDPPGRSTMWRQGWNTPVSYSDNQLFCGGFETQWTKNGGLCGLCGDPYDGEREHEWGGKFATGTVVRHYKAGDVVTIAIQVTANHKGWFEFRLCPNDEPINPATQECLDNHLLKLADGSTRYAVSVGVMFDVQVKLPAGLTCNKCLFQWKYHAGNSWGVDTQTGEGCVGCGPQEEFYACADVKISQNGGTVAMPTTATTTTTTTVPPTPTVDIVCANGVYVASDTYASSPTMTPWCEITCPTGYCPSSHCQCG